MEEARTWGPTSQTVPRKVTESQMNEDRMLNNRLSDVENKTDQYDSTFQAELSPKDYTLIAGLAQKAKIDWHGLNIDTSALYQPAFLSELSPEGQARLISYRNAREAMTGYQRVLSGSGRSSDKSMELNLETLPAPNDPASFARHSVAAFRDNLRIVGQGLPKLPGVQQPKVNQPSINVPTFGQFGK